MKADRLEHKVARYFASGILRKRGVPETPEAMAGLLPACYVAAQGFMQAADELISGMADDLAGGIAVLARSLVPAASGPAGIDMGEFEAEFPADHPDND